MSPALFERAQPLFEMMVNQLRRHGMADEFIARQLVDDFFRATGQSLHGVQHLVEQLVAQTRRW